MPANGNSCAVAIRVSHDRKKVSSQPTAHSKFCRLEGMRADILRTFWVIFQRIWLDYLQATA
jgi:hypothetical protein